MEYELLFVGFVLGIVGGTVGDIIRIRLREKRDREILCDGLRDEFQLLHMLLDSIIEQGREHREMLGGVVGPAYSDHAKRDLELARQRFTWRLENLHLIQSAWTRQKLREYQHLLYSVAVSVQTLDDREQYGLDLPDEGERAVSRASWREHRKGVAERCEQWLIVLRDDAAALLQEIPS